MKSRCLDLQSLPAVLATALLLTLPAGCVGQIADDTAGPADEQGAEAAELAYPDEPGTPTTLAVPFEDGSAALAGRRLDADRTVVMGDIVLSERELGARSTGVVLGRRWPDAVVYYTVSSGSDYRVTQAIANWQTNTNLVFRVRNQETNYVQFNIMNDGSGCFSDYIGMKGGRQIINLDSGCTPGNAIHEIGHIVGLSHEQQRTDRDTYLVVNTSKLGASEAAQYAKIDGTVRFNMTLFDFGSVMMYGSWAQNNTVVMTRRSDGSTFGGQRVGLSDLDKASIWFQYRTSATSSIRAKFDSLGGQAAGMGFLTTGEDRQADNVGYRVGLETGAIYWSPATGAHDIRADIYQRYLAFGGPTSFLGYPSSDATALNGLAGLGKVSHFQNGSIYSSSATGAKVIYGQIRNKYFAMGADNSALGYPTTDELGTPDGVGRFNHFAVNGSIYWTPTTGAVAILGAVRAKWAAMGWERSCLGYPISDATAVLTGGRRGFTQRFQHGTITAMDGLAAGATCTP